MRIILADDSDLIIDRLTAMLAMYSKAEIVGVYSNGTDALEGIRTLSPDLAILDIKMPGLTGLEVTSAARKENKKLRIIILTFYSSEYYKSLAIKSGADFFLNKVDEFDEVSMVVAGLLWKRSFAERNVGTQNI